MLKRLLVVLLCLATLRTPQAQAVGEIHNVQLAIQRLNEIPADPQTSEAFDLISLLGNYPFFETMDALLVRAQLEVQAISQRYANLNHGHIKDHKAEIKPDMLLHIIQSMSKEASQEYSRKLATALKPLNQIAIQSEPFETELANALEAFHEKVQQNEAEAQKNNAPVLANLKEAASKINPGAQLLPALIITKSKSSIAKDRAAFISYMKTRFIGQPELIEMAADSYIDSKILTKATTPSKMFLMGLKGSGAETFVKLFADYQAGGGPGWGNSDIYVMPVAKDKSALWRIFGSTAGYVDSENVPNLIRFLVDHSGGKLRIEEGEKNAVNKQGTWAIFDNEVEDATASVRNLPPSRGIVYIPNFQNWTQDLKDELMTIVTSGIWPIMNPGKGKKEIQVPVRIIFSTSEGSGLIAARDVDGSRFGEPLSIEKMHEKWQDVSADRERLLRELQRSNLLRDSDGARLGYSTDFISVLKGLPITLLEPQNTENLQAITNLRLQDLSLKYQMATELKGSTVNWDERLTKFVQEFRFFPEDMATGINGNVELLVRKTLNTAISQDQFANLLEPVDISIFPYQVENGTWEMQFELRDLKTKKSIHHFQIPIQATAQDKSREPMPDSEVKRLLGLAQHLKERVFGLHPKLINNLTNSVLLAEENKYKKPSDKNDGESDSAKAALFGFFGLSSTGKTQTAKEVNHFINGGRTPITLNFSTIQTVEALEALLLGYRDSKNLPVASDFMKHYERNNGEVLIVLDELSNAPIKVTRALYDILREPIITTFSDNWPRPMQKVKLFITGNAGEEIYRGIPTDIPEWIRMYAMQEIYQQFINDPAASRAAVENYFSQALLNRIGEQNINHFGPLTFKSLRELSQFKLLQMVQKLKPQDGLRGWDLNFESESSFLNVIEAIENHGFVLAEQGASIDRFVFEVLLREIRVNLLKNGVPSGELVTLKYLKDQDQIVTEGGQTSVKIKFLLKLSSGRQLEFILGGRPVQDTSSVRDEDRYLTAVHETGHMLVRKLLFGDTFKPVKISTIPGVTPINNKWVLYKGIASAKEVRETRMTLEAVIAEMAVLSGGYVAQILVTKGRRHDSGKSNDMERMTTLAHRAILAWGLSERWGTSTIPTDMSINQYIESLSEARRNLLSEEVERLIERARLVAESALMANIDNAMIPIANALATEGVLNEGRLDTLLKEHTLNYAVNGRFRLNIESQRRWSQSSKAGTNTIDAQLLDVVVLPKKMARYEDIVAADRLEAQKSVALPKNIPLAPKVSLSDMLKRASGAKSECTALLEYKPSTSSVTPRAASH